MEVRSGYKLTEIGTLPEQWEVKPLRSVLYTGRLGGNYPNQDAEAEFPLMKMGNLARGHFDLSKIEYIVPGVAPKSEHRLHRGDVLFNTRNTLDLVGKVAIWRNELPVAYYNSNLMRLAFDSNEISSTEYANYALNTAGSVARLRALATGTTSVAAIYTRDLMGLLFVVPPSLEQRAIASALTDVDALLDGLDRLIAKKRDLKQAAMQQLLTGMTRLPGFHGEWEVKRLKDVAEISTGINKPLSEMGSGALYVTVQDLYDGTSIRTDRLSRIKVSRSEVDTRSLAIGDIVFGKSSVKRDGIGYPSQFRGCGEPVVFSGFSYRARARRGVADATFLLYGLRAQRTRRWLIDNSQASALTNINQTISDAIPIRFPPTVPEQIAIAAVLSDMDAELSALEARRDKTCALKQGMMQELLTGRTRLV